jgi:hypothetical protein
MLASEQNTDGRSTKGAWILQYRPTSMMFVPISDYKFNFILLIFETYYKCTFSGAKTFFNEPVVCFHIFSISSTIYYLIPQT